MKGCFMDIFNKGDEIFFESGDQDLPSGNAIILNKGIPDHISPVARMYEIQMEESSTMILAFYGELCHKKRQFAK